MKKNKVLLFLVLIIAVLVLLNLSLNSIKKITFNSTREAASFLSGAGDNFKNIFSFFSRVSHLKEENADLVRKIGSFEVDLSRIDELEQENQVLKNELGFVQNNKELEIIPSRIVGREPTSFLDYVMVDKGKVDGVKEKAAVISNGSLVGQVKEVYDKTAKVVLITSKDSNILAMLQESRAKGILKGGISGLILEDIIQDVVIKPGEYVVTSGLEGEIQQGILIGKTGQLGSAASDLFKNVSVEPIVDFSKLEVVFIIK